MAVDADLSGLAVPTLAVGAEHDVYFPGRKLTDRVRALVPGAETELIPGSNHCPPTTDAFRGWLADRVTTTFLGGRR